MARGPGDQMSHGRLISLVLRTLLLFARAYRENLFVGGTMAGGIPAMI